MSSSTLTVSCALLVGVLAAAADGGDDDFDDNDDDDVDDVVVDTVEDFLRILITSCAYFL